MGSLEFFFHVLRQLRPQDLVDIALVFLVVYRLLLLIRGTRSVHMLTGLGILSLSLILSEHLRLFVINYLLKQFFEYLFLIVIILFQDEIRRALANIGKNPFFAGRSAKGQALKILEEIVRASQNLASNRVGALIVIERHHGLKNYMEGAVSIKAEVSAELLVAIFQNSSPIHDGAVIVGDGKLLAAGCFVPVMIDGKHDRRLGTRHLAAIGLSKETDAYVVVVSEERGEISVVENGRLVRNVSAQELREALRAAFDLSAVRSNLNEEGGSDAVET